MKKIALFLSVITSFYGYSQSSKYSVPVSRLTEIMIEKKYSSVDREELNKYPLKLQIMDYIYSKSFEISENKQYTAEQFEKIDIDKYNLARKLDENVSIFDEASGLKLILYSLNRMKEDKNALLPSNMQNQDPSSKIAR